MIKIDLVTGFLGSGKTTFIKKYAKYLMDRGLKIGILENDYGAVNVDMMLLQELRGENCELEMVAGACDFDCHKRRFKTKLISMGMSGYDRIIVEPSGIFDVDEFFDALYEEPLCMWYETGSVIAIVDAALEEELSEQSEYLLASQVANAGSVVLSRTGEASGEDITRVTAHMNRALEWVQCKRVLSDEICSADWEDFTEKELETFANCGYRQESYRKFPIHEENGYGSVYFMNLSLSVEQMQSAARSIFQDESCGRVFRIKGFLKTGENHWVEVNATRKKTNITTIAEGQEVFIIIGENLSEEKIRSYFA